MRFVIAQRSLSHPGGSETFVLTVAEHLSRLGHEVVVWASELGLSAEVGRARNIEIVGEGALPPQDVDATISLDRVMAIDLALRYPHAVRLYAMHNSNEVWLPPPEPGIVAATLAPNDRLACLARGCAGAGEVVRIKQPVDILRFTPASGWPRQIPSRVLLIGNYFGFITQRADSLQSAWSRPGLEWRRLGHPEPTTEVSEEMAKADIVVGYGRSILEAMACGRAAYVHEHSGSDGWVTAANYERLEADGFAGIGLRPPPSLDALREDFRRYDPSLGRDGRDLAFLHDARLVVAGLVSLVDQFGPPARAHDPHALRALRNLAESRFRADLEIGSLRARVKSTDMELSRLNDELSRLHDAARAKAERRRARGRVRKLFTYLRSGLIG